MMDEQACRVFQASLRVRLPGRVRSPNLCEACSGRRAKKSEPVEFARRVRRKLCGFCKPALPCPEPALEMRDLAGHGAAQRVSVHTDVEQSLASAHACHNPHGEQSGPPQSTSVSSPFADPSRQLGDWQVPVQTLLAQSACVVQAAALAQAGHEPPQSVALSSPFLRVSVQLGAAQLSATQ